jgi:transketolase
MTVARAALLKRLEAEALQIRYANQRVVIGAAASGISLGVSGGTPHALEDLALMRSLPYMTVIVPADTVIACGAVAELLAVEHPTRMRLVGMPDDFAVVGPTVPRRLPPPAGAC